jgi:predicted DNA binding CopG/RHH family protein
MKTKEIPKKRVRAIRFSDKMWQEIKRRAALKEMRPSEYVRRLVELHLEALAQIK